MEMKNYKKNTKINLCRNQIQKKIKKNYLMSKLKKGTKEKKRKKKEIFLDKKFKIHSKN